MNTIKDFLEYIFNAFKIWVIVQPWQIALIVRNGNRTKEVSGGIYFKIPYFDSVFIQENRMRIISFPMQTITTKDGASITLSTSLGYTIQSIHVLYKTLYHPESTLQNMAMAFVSDYIYVTNFKDIDLQKLEQLVMEKLKAEDYGLTFTFFKFTNFANVKTFRLIQDTNWVYEGLTLDNKK